MTEVIAIYKYEKTKEEDLSFKKDERLTIIDRTTDSNWVIARNERGETGLVPINFLESEKEPFWLHTDICREEAERLLNGRKPGSFLVRMSSVFSGDYTLCLMTDEPNIADDPGVNLNLAPAANHKNSGLVQHYHIHSVMRMHGTTVAQFFSLDEVTEFPSLRTLIRFYTDLDRGLAHRLIYPVRNLQRDRLNLLKSNHWIQKDEITLGEKLDKGEFCDVLRGTFRNTDVAIKKYNASEKKLLIYEAWIMTSLKHRNIVSLVGVTEDVDGTFYLIMEYLSTGSLLRYLRSRGRFLITPFHLLSFAIGVADALVYLETRGFLHCDIAARNVLLSNTDPIPIAKLGDFGLACYPISMGVHSQIGSLTKLDELDLIQQINDCERSIPVHQGGPANVARSSKIPIKWTAPECIRSKVFSHKSDVWSFGILLWELYSFGRLPYPQLMTSDVLKYVESGERMSAPKDCPPQIYSLMRKMWNSEPKLRPSFLKILEQLKSLLTVTSNYSNSVSKLNSSLAFPLQETGTPSKPISQRTSSNFDHVYESDFVLDTS